jgi:cytochrome c553
MRHAVAVAVAVWMLVATLAQAAGDAAAGKGKSNVCVACHGADGNSTNPQWPKLAGQVPDYIVTQLQNFKQGKRHNPLMAPIAQGLSEQDMLDLAAYFSSQELEMTGATDAGLAKQGERLYRGGNADSEIAACMGCHGPTGHGIPPRFPRLSGQHAAYTKQQLLAFKDGKRVSDGDIMTSIAFRMSEQEIDALAQYISGLH